ncbi:response regulator [Photobacterium damselae subsp. damselae]|uniref:response regulator n=1 Tax=Photobacterium damselae TaxID=38293 RepID=UPI00311AD7F8
MNYPLYQQQFTLTIDNLKQIRKWINDKHKRLSFCPTITKKLQLIISEYCTNLLNYQSVTASHIQLISNQTSGEYQFTILDNGTFWLAFEDQLNQAQLPKQPCTSHMGLALLNSILDSYQYTLTEQGNAFSFTIHKNQEKPRLLLIDDSSSQLNYLASLLQRDYQLTLFSSSAEGLNWLKDHSCELVITDIHMPEMDGFHFRQQVAKQSCHSLLPFIFLTGDLNRSTQSAASQLEIDDYLKKPIDKETLYSVIERVLKRHRRLQSHLEHALSQHISPQVQQENDHRKSHNLQIEYHQDPQDSGDFLLTHYCQDERELIVVGDHMGSGLIARTNGSGWISFIRGLFCAGIESPQQLLTLLNQEIYQTSHSQLICLMIIEIQQDSQITIYNSAMPAPLLVGLEHSEYQQEHISLLGLNEQITIEGKDYYLSSEQSLHIASDGIFEQKLSQRQQKQIQNQEKTTRGTYLWESSLNIKDDKTLVNIYLADPISEL